MARKRNPYLVRFLSDFTLGFADGLIVPFALTAGLSSLGRADTVISAGLAELCADSISMGIGGYLSARDELPAASSHQSSGEEGADAEELVGMLQSGSTSETSTSTRNANRSIAGEKATDLADFDKVEDSDLVRRYLAPLRLPPTTMSEIMSALRLSPDDLTGAALVLRQEQKDWHDSPPTQLPVWPIASAIFISLGYIIGGSIPLVPYFAASTVGRGLRWSACLCLLTLMAYGSGKSYLLRGESRSGKRCLLEGLQMLILGGLAAGAAVICVRAKRHNCPVQRRLKLPSADAINFFPRRPS